MLGKQQKIALYFTKKMAPVAFNETEFERAGG